MATTTPISSGQLLGPDIAIRKGTTSATPLLAVLGLSLGYESRSVLKEITCGLNYGEVVGVIGPNGSGKSTLLRGISGLLSPLAGRALIDGADILRLRSGDLARLMAAVPQNPNLPETFTALEIVLMGRSPHLGFLQSEGARDVAIARTAMLRTETWDLADRPIGQLSGGERQRVVIARALAQEPRLLLLDEPTAHLDIHHQVQIMEIVSSLCQEHRMGVLAVLHDLNLAAQYCDRLLLLYQGGIFASGTPHQVITAENVARVYGAHVYVDKHPVNQLPMALVAASNCLRRRNGGQRARRCSTDHSSLRDALAENLYLDEA